MAMKLQKSRLYDRNRKQANEIKKAPNNKIKNHYMSIGTFSYPMPVNEPVLSYAPGSKEKEILKATLVELKSQQADIPMYIGNKEVRTNKKIAIHPPHEIKHTLGHFHA